MKQTTLSLATLILCTTVSLNLSAKPLTWGQSYEGDSLATAADALNEYRIGKSSLRASDVQEAIREVKNLNKKIDNLESKNRELERQNSDLQRKVEDNRQQLRSLESEIKNLSSKIK